jgi:hypothetical protein
MPANKRATAMRRDCSSNAFLSTEPWLSKMYALGVFTAV